MAKQLISESVDWKDLLEKIKNHAFTKHDLNTMARLNELMRAIKNPEKGIGVYNVGKKRKSLKKIEKF